VKSQGCEVCAGYERLIASARDEGREEAVGWWRDSQVLHFRYADEHRVQDADTKEKN
jgi:hypothetical protein